MNSERTIEFEFVRATENAALNSLPWLGRGEKEKADGAACDAIYGGFDLVDICGEVVIGEGQKDNAPGIFLGDHLGTWRLGSPRFEIALDPIDGTTISSLRCARPAPLCASSRTATSPPPCRPRSRTATWNIYYGIGGSPEGILTSAVRRRIENCRARLALAYRHTTWQSEQP